MLGLSIPEVAGRARARPDPATAALVARMSTAPGPARTGHINALVAALKAAGIWPRLTCLYLLAAHDAQAARLNWVQDAHDLAAVDAPAFIADRGYAGDGAASHLDTGWSPSLGAQNSLCLGIWSRSEGQTASANGAYGGSTQGAFVGQRYPDDTCQARVNSGAPSMSAACADGRGLFCANRSGATATQLFRNGVQVAAGSASSTAPTTASVRIGSSGPGAFNSGQYAACVIGQSLAAGEQLALYDALLAYVLAVGA